MAAPSPGLGDHEGESAETGVAVGCCTMPVEISEGDAGVAPTIPVEISDAGAGAVPSIPVLISDDGACAVAAGTAWPPASEPSPLFGDAIAEPAPTAAIPATTVSTATLSR